jgi:hypothetical protein
MDQHTKYSNRDDVCLANCSFINDNRGYDYLCFGHPKQGDFGVVHTRDGPKAVLVNFSKPSSEIIKNPPFKKYGWVRAIIDKEEYQKYDTIDDEVEVQPHSLEGGQAIEKHQLKTESVDELLDKLF